MIHVCLNELKSLVLDHSCRLWLNKLLEVVHLFSGNAFSILGGFKGSLEDVLDVGHSLDALSHSQAEVTEPLVIDCDSPVLTEEFNGVWNDALIVSRSQGVQVVLVKSNETPNALQHNFLASHVSH